jgi:hypothetical protein
MVAWATEAPVPPEVSGRRVGSTEVSTEVSGHRAGSVESWAEVATRRRTGPAEVTAEMRRRLTRCMELAG